MHPWGEELKWGEIPAYRDVGSDRKEAFGAVRRRVKQL